MENKISKIDAIKQTLSVKYDIRFNTITGKLQLKTVGEDEYQEVDSSIMSEIKKELKENGIKATESEIQKAFEGKIFNRKKETSACEEIELYLETVIETRFNSIKQKPEYRYIGEDEYKPVTKYFVNSMNRQISAMGIKCSANKLNEIFFSDFSQECDPVKDFFYNMDEFDITQGDAIKELCDTVTVVNAEKWYEYFKKWLVAVVANGMVDEKCMNHTMLVLTGQQGAFKTTWLDNLTPKELRQYSFTGKIDPSNKDIQTMMAEFFLINIDDQLKQLNKKDENDLKNMITVNNVKYRRPYDIFIQEYPHLASFMGSINGNEFLTDPTGSRRFLPFEVLKIDINKAQKLNINRCWQQAYHLFKQGFRYWFTSDEVDELNKSNQNFQVVSTEEQLLLQYFDKPKNRGEATHFMQHAEIMNHISLYTKVQIRSKPLGEALAKHSFEKWRRTAKDTQLWVYSVIVKDIDHVNNGMKASYLEKEETSNKLPF